MELCFWGFFGAFSYASYVLTMKLKEAPKAWRIPLAEYVIALIMGTVFGRAFAPAIAYYFPWTGKPDMVALAFMIGLCANPAAPIISKAVVSRVVRKINPGEGSI